MSAQPGPARASPAGLRNGGATRPRMLVLGDLAEVRALPALQAALDLREATADEVLGAFGGDDADAVLLDGRLPGELLNRILEVAGHPGDGHRPVVLVLTDQGRRTHVEARLIDHADDFVNPSLGEEVLLGRVRAALRLRAVLGELSRKNAELEGLYARVEAMAGRMAEELRLASQIQRSLLPPPLHHPRLDVAAEFIPVREIGGDYYDFVTLGTSRLAVAVGDVMGKGVPAALLASNLKACLRAHLEEGGVDPGALIGRVNRLFWDITPKGLFASLFFGILDFEKGALDYVNAGHDHPLLVRTDGSVESLAEGGPVLGLLEQAHYERGRVGVSLDDVLVLYSDGITDRANQAGELFGLDRLKEAARRGRRDGARLMLYTLLGDVQGWSSGSPAEDDMTLIVARIR